MDRETGKPLDDLNDWAGELNLYQKKINQKGLKLVVAGPPPMFHYTNIETCNFKLFGLDPCSSDRSGLDKNIKNVQDSCWIIEISKKMHTFLICLIFFALKIKQFVHPLKITSLLLETWII